MMFVLRVTISFVSVLTEILNGIPGHKETGDGPGLSRA